MTYTTKIHYQWKRNIAAFTDNDLNLLGAEVRSVAIEYFPGMTLGFEILYTANPNLIHV